MPNLRSSLNDLASSFTNAVLAAIRTASLEELLGEGQASRPSGRRRRAAASDGAKAPVAARPSSSSSRGGRLRRRSADEIAKVLDSIVSLLKKNRAGLRAEQIRSELGLQAKEMPRVLKEGLSSQKLKSKGQKRATT